MPASTTIDCLRGDQIDAWIPALAALRIAVFRDWPYLYAGDAAYEAVYLRTYAQAPDALLVLVRAGEQVIGCSTAVPLVQETSNVQAPFVAAGIDIAQVCYFGESVLLPAWRGLGLGHRFFDAREAHARALPGVRQTAFCAVDRDPADPRRPAAARPLDAFWTARGYRRQPQLRAQMHWQEVDSTAATDHTLTFWTRTL